MGERLSLRPSSERVRPRLVRRSRMSKTSSIASSRRSRATMSFSTSSVFSSIAFLSSVNSSSDRRRVRRRVLLLLTIGTFSCALPVRILRRKVYLARTVFSFPQSSFFTDRRPSYDFVRRAERELKLEKRAVGFSPANHHLPTRATPLFTLMFSSSTELTYDSVSATSRKSAPADGRLSQRRNSAPPLSGLKTRVSGLASIAFVQTQTLATASAVD